MDVWRQAGHSLVSTQLLLQVRLRLGGCCGRGLLWVQAGWGCGRRLRTCPALRCCPLLKPSLGLPLSARVGCRVPMLCPSCAHRVPIVCPSCAHCCVPIVVWRASRCGNVAAILELDDGNQKNFKVGGLVGGLMGGLMGGLNGRAEAVAEAEAWLPSCCARRACPAASAVHGCCAAHASGSTAKLPKASPPLCSFYFSPCSSQCFSQCRSSRLRRRRRAACPPRRQHPTTSCSGDDVACTPTPTAGWPAR